MPDFAATLTTQAEQDAEEDNVSFLRTTENHSRRRSPYLNPAEFDYPPARDHTEREAQRRMRRAVAQQHRRYTAAQLQELDRQNDTSPAHRTALRHPISYQGWAPGTSDTETDDPELLRQQRLQLEHNHRRRDEAVRRQLVSMQRNQLAVQLADRENGVNWGQSHFIEDGSAGAEPTTTEASLRTTALLQSVRRHARFSTRSREQLENYILERERSNQMNDELGGAPLTRQRTVETPARRAQREDEEQETRIRTRIAAMERNRQGITSESPPDASRWLEEAIKYLERLRFCDTYPDRISSAAEGGFTQGTYFTDPDDFILDTASIPPPPESSWLKVGGVFSGSQHAAGGAGLPSYQVTNRPFRRTASSRLNSHTATTPQTPSSQLPPLISATASSTPAIPSSSDSWPVKVTINSIDYENMTLSGTMEAFNVPQKTYINAPPKESSITTFLEGEIIDFNRYTLETQSFPADASVDSTYWRKLEPFKGLSEGECVSRLVSARWLSEELRRGWVLMRWKGEFFWNSFTQKLPRCEDRVGKLLILI